VRAGSVFNAGFVPSDSADLSFGAFDGGGFESGEGSWESGGAALETRAAREGSIVKARTMATASASDSQVRASIVRMPREWFLWVTSTTRNPFALAVTFALATTGAVPSRSPSSLRTSLSTASRFGHVAGACQSRSSEGSACAGIGTDIVAATIAMTTLRGNAERLKMGESP
jgi:hypothetical protein